MDMEPIIEQIRRHLADVKFPVSVAVMGCVVNGPGEAEGADVAICAGKGKAVLYRGGKRLRTVNLDEMVQAVVEEVRRIGAARG
jgi:(E)-4-hydroxy-3-methylbut-2-enyl-diphosphate synthase